MREPDDPAEVRVPDLDDLREREESCDICSYGGEDCGACDGSGEYDGYGSTCYGCYGSGWTIPPHCCLCGGSPYCTCCRRCRRCVAQCSCPIEVRKDDGSVMVV